MAFTDVIKDPPTTPAEWDRINRREHYLHLKSPDVIQQMYQMHKEKAVRIDKEYQSHVDHPGYYRKKYMDNGMTLGDANAQVIVAKDYFNEKRKRLKSIVECCSVEYEKVEGKPIE